MKRRNFLKITLTAFAGLFSPSILADTITSKPKFEFDPSKAYSGLLKFTPKLEDMEYVGPVRDAIKTWHTTDSMLVDVINHAAKMIPAKAKLDFIYMPARYNGKRDCMVQSEYVGWKYCPENQSLEVKLEMEAGSVDDQNISARLQKLWAEHQYKS